MGIWVVSFLFTIFTITAQAEVSAAGGGMVYPSERTTNTPSPRASQYLPARSPATNSQSVHQVTPPFSTPASPIAKTYASPAYKNGAGPTGVKWDSGSKRSTGAEAKNFDSEGAGQCGEGQNLWAAAAKVMNEKVIPTRKGYDLNAPSWPKISGAQGSLKCDFSAHKQSMCTSATAAALCQHFVDLIRDNHVQLTPEQIRFLNGPQVKAALNGNTFSVAKLIQHLGGTSMFSGHSGGVRAVLAEAQTGDIVRFDRNNGTGHSAIFKESTPTQFCYWTSNTATGGVGVQCEYIGPVSQMVISRFPGDVENLGSRIDIMRASLMGFSSAQANTLGPESVAWANQLNCPSEDRQSMNQQVAASFHR